MAATFLGNALSVAERPREGSRGLQPTVKSGRGLRRVAPPESFMPSRRSVSRRYATKFHADPIRGLKSTATFILSLRENLSHPLASLRLCGFAFNPGLHTP